MISQDTIQRLAVQYHIAEHPHVVREYFQHLFLSELYKLENSQNLLFKDGTALRIIYGSPRFSEDLDFSIFGVEPAQQKVFIESLFANVLTTIEQSGARIELGQKPGSTSEGYYGDATFQAYDYPPVVVSINISSRNGRRIQGEIDSIANDFIPTYNVFHLPQVELVEEKVFSALLERKKARDFYDLYFMMRKRMLSVEQKTRLFQFKDSITSEAKNIDFRSELSVFLPVDQQGIIQDFQDTLTAELGRQLSGA